MFGCDCGQGYFISRPRTAEDFIRWLAESPWGPAPAPIHDWFTEGLDTPDLSQAKTFLEHLP